MELNLLNPAFSIVVFQLLFVAIFLFSSKKGKRISNVLLGIFFLLLAVNLLELLLKANGIFLEKYKIVLVDDALLLTLGPLVYLYTLSVIFKDFSVKFKYVLHFVPAIMLAFFLFIVSYHSPPDEYTSMVNRINNFSLPAPIKIMVLLLNLHMLAYLFYSYKKVKKFKEVVMDKYSAPYVVNYRWLGFTIKSIAVFMLVALLHTLVPYTFSPDYLIVTLFLLIVLISYFINVAIFKALNGADMFTGIVSKPEAKYSSSSLTAEETELIREKLITIMQDQKPHLDPNLSIDQLAEMVNIHAKKLSQVINQSFNKTFFDFINWYRIEEAKTLILTSTDHKKTILEILYQSGINSKSSFNTLFKKNTGLTPTAFKKNH